MGPDRSRWGFHNISFGLGLAAPLLLVVLFAVMRAVEAPKTAVDPNDPRRLLATVKAPPGFDVTLFAAPPRVAYPTCLCATPDGVVFVGIDQNGSLGAKAKRGHVLRCLDTDGDGVADKFNVFATMDSPRGLWFDHNTLYVLHPPFLTAYHDDDGDGVADRSDVLVSGLGMTLKQRGADHTTNGFRMGIDGWFYIAVGDYGANPAKGKDGATVRLHGGGVMRVRPDGSGLELIADGLRNIYDVAVSPRLDLFTRDNTNDGGGWDVRLSHIVPTGHYGYPTLFQHFGDEIIQPLADYGGGAPCGSLFLDEPGFPKEFGTALYTCDWGRGEVYRHPLTPNGASWKTEQQSFLRIPRPTDMDVDGSGRLYVSSWKDGGFDYSGPNVGFVVRVTPKDHKPAPPPDWKKATDAELLKHLTSPSQVVRLHTQREVLRRGVKPIFAEGLEKLAAVHDALAVRVAAIFTLKQLLGAASNEALLRLAKLDAVREFALRALADNKSQLADVPAQPFVKALADANPRVRVQAVVGLARLNKPRTAASLLSLTADADPIVAHVAVNALVKLRAAEVCLQTLDNPDAAKFVPGALRVLQALHEPAVVDGLIARYRKINDPLARRLLLRTLARLYQREADWDGKWWGTRPDTTGPYFKPVAWNESKKIAEVLRGAFAGADTETLRWLIQQLHRNRVDLPEMTAALLKLADKDVAFRRLAVEVFADRGSPPEEAVVLFGAVAAATDEAPALRVKCLRALLRLSAKAAAREAAVAALTAEEKPPRQIVSAWAEFARDGRHAGNVADFVKLAGDDSAARRELAYGVLASIAGRNFGSGDARATAAAAVEKAWSKPESAVPLLRAVARLNLSTYAPQVRRLFADPNVQVATAAKATASALKLDRDAAGNQPLIGSLKYEDVVARASKAKGDAALGATLFSHQGCVNCHTVSAEEMPKGPFLGGIATRYSKAELFESILRPSAKIAQGFETNLITLTNGKQLTGFVIRESGTEIEIRDGAGAGAVLKKSAIDERERGTVSVMPEKLVDNLTPRELASLLAYLASLKGK
ncbi:MAG TPA: HEAT repeat domain-containing protein [Gemmataceae bacterium]|jgi:putative membrane-bound dehydrogenase-like protein